MADTAGAGQRKLLARNVLAPYSTYAGPAKKSKELGQEFAELTRVAPSRNTTKGTIKTIDCGGKGLDPAFPYADDSGVKTR
jgi:hypothetical protein